TLKRRCATEPLVDDDAQRVLVAGRRRLAMKLFGGHIGGCTDNPRRNGGGAILCVVLVWTDGYAKIAQHKRFVLCEQHIFRFDVAVYDLPIMGILQRG